MTEEKKSMVPKLRFPEFTATWEQRKLGDIGTVQMNKRIFKTQTSTSGEIPFYKIGTFGKIPDAYISRELFEEYKKKYPYPKKGDLLLSASGSIGNVVEYNGEEAYFQDSNIVWLEHGKTISNLFLKAFYSVVNWEGTEGTTIKRLYNKTILDTPITLPSFEEQEKIGNFFTVLDKVITLHQRKLEGLSKLKKSLLQKMFPKNGSLEPELRFPGFTGDWEQRKLKDFTLSYSGGTPTVSNKNYYNGTIPFIRSGEISGERTELFISEEGLNKSSAKRVHKGQILYALYGATSGEVSLSKIDGAINQAVLAISTKEGYSNAFLSFWLRKEKDRITATFLQGGQGNLSGEIVKDLIVPVPSQLEQTKIGDFFNQLDGLITLHQRKLESLKKLKKSLLQQMFV